MEAEEFFKCLLCPAEATGFMKTDDAGHEHVRVCRFHLKALEMVACMRCALKRLYANNPREAENMLSFMLRKLEIHPGEAKAVPWRYKSWIKRLYWRARFRLTREDR